MKVSNMTKHGKIVHGNGARLDIAYQVTAPGPDNIYHGQLIGDLRELDPVYFADRIGLVCQSGLTLSLLITHQTSRGATFVGVVSDNGHSIPIETIGSMSNSIMSGGAA